MEWKRITVIAILQALVPITDADALGLADPKLCFILDGILLIYAIIITACFIKAKKLSAGRRDEYDSLGVGKADADIEMGGRKQHRRKQAQDKVYTSLQRDKMGEAYSEIGKKGERRRGKGTDTVYQGLSAATRDTYDVLQMQQLQTPY
nr:T-cell surface glycoprotein CD3 zeta chain isoform X2 [Pogona vitticeps]